MAGTDVIKEYLVSMGLQDNFTDNFNKVLDDSGKKMGKFAHTFAGKFALAGVAVVSATTIANIAVGKFLGNLAKSDLAMEMYAKSIGKTKHEAIKLDTTLKAMGRTLEEVNSNAELKMNFEKLQKDAEKVQPPDMSEGMKQIREIQLEFVRLKQNATYALNWVGYYLTKYLKDPIEKIQKGFKGLNDIVIKNMPKWTDNIAKVLSWVVRLGTTLVRGATTAYKAIKRIFDMIPREIKIVGAALIGLGLLIRAGPIGKLAMVITGLLLLLDDFYTYIDGGDALLGGFWQRLIDIYETLKNSGAIDKFKESMTNALKFASDKVIALKDYVIDLFNKFKESDSIEKFIKLLKNIIDIVGLIIKPISAVGREIIDAFGGKGKDLIDWLVTVALPKALDLLNSLTDKIKAVLTKLNDLGATKEIIKGIALAFAGWKIKKGLVSGISGISNSLDTANKWLKGFDEGLLKLNKKDFSNTIGKLTGLKKNLKSISETVYLKVSYSKVTSAFKSVGKAGKTALQGINKFGKTAVSSVVKYGGKAAKGALSGIKTAGFLMIKGIGSAVGFLTSPMGLAILAIGALITIAVLVIKNWDKVKEFFINLWSGIKETFSPIGEWFGEKFSQAKEAIIKVFSPIAAWFSGKISAITKIFSSIPSSVRDTFIKVVNNIKNIFSPMVDWFKEKIDKIKGFFGGIGDKVKGIFGKGDPGTDDDKPKPNPKPIGHSQGGLFFKRHEAEIAEDGAEAVIPLTKPNKAREILSQIRNFIGPDTKDQGGGVNLDGIKQSMSQIVSVLSGVKNGLNQQQNVNYTSNGGNVTIQNITISPQSHNKIYGSGNPETTANAINRNTVNSTGLLLRNTQGAFG